MDPSRMLGPISGKRSITKGSTGLQIGHQFNLDTDVASGVTSLRI